MNREQHLKKIVAESYKARFSSLNEATKEAPLAPGAAGASGGGSGLYGSCPTPPIITTGLLALYDAEYFEEGTSHWPDSSCNDFGMATIQPGTTTIPNKVTTGVGAPYLEVNNSHMRVDKSSSTWSQNSYTQEAWVNFTDDYTYSGITDFSPSEEYAMYWGGDGGWFTADQLIMTENGTNQFPLTGGASLPWGGGPSTGWHHLTISFSSDGILEANSILSIYINGVLGATSTGDAGIGVGPGENDYLDIVCAAADADEYGLRGQVGYIALYDRPLSAPEVLSNFDATKARFGL